jgi:methyltransferase family protein
VSMRDAGSGCPACGDGEGSPFFHSELSWSIRSDGAALPASAAAENCIRCGHVFKQGCDARRWADYERYEAYGDDPSRDKLDFGTGAPVARSAALLAYLREEGVLAAGMDVLDYGCHRGALLALLGAGRHAGFDVSERYRSVVESLGFAYHGPAHPPPEAAFDLLTLVHVAEHLVDPPLDLEAGLRALRGDGRMVVQVPEIRSQPTDLYVMDHRSHFSADSLDRAMARAGLSPVRRTRSVIPGELTGVYARGPGPIPLPPGPSPEARSARDVLRRGEARLHEILRQDRPCVVFGAGLLGTILVSVLGGRVTGVVDDDAGRHRGRLLGLEVIPLAAVRPGTALVVVAVPPTAARRVADRCRELGHEVLAPFTLEPA